MTSVKKSSDCRQLAQCAKTCGVERGPYVEAHDDQFDARCYRPLHVIVQLDVSDIQAHLVKVNIM